MGGCATAARAAINDPHTLDDANPDKTCQTGVAQQIK